jgi:hypothetical protein
MAKRAKGLKILKIVIILAITFLAGIIITFCQKQSNPVVKDENVTTQTNSKPKKHKKSDAKKDKGKDTKVSVTISTPSDEKRGEYKKAVDENGLRSAEAEYYKKQHLNPQPETDPLLDNDHYMGEFYSDDSEPEYNTTDNDSYYVPNTTNSSSAITESYSSQTTVAENNQTVDNASSKQGGNYGNN